jgi:outer membrane cobalamin receptor
MAARQHLDSPNLRHALRHRQMVTDESPSHFRRKSASPATGEATAGSAAADNDGSAGTDIVVTGTNLRGGGPASSPVIRLDRAAIERTGATTTDQLLRAIPSNQPYDGVTALANGPNVTNNNGRGAAVNLRGLGPGSTLTLLNGLRGSGWTEWHVR